MWKNLIYYEQRPNAKPMNLLQEIIPDFKLQNGLKQKYEK